MYEILTGHYTILSFSDRFKESVYSFTDSVSTHTHILGLGSNTSLFSVLFWVSCVCAVTIPGFPAVMWTVILRILLAQRNHGG